MSLVHPRTTIRAYAKALLKSEVIDIDRIVTSKPTPLAIQQLPCILIHFDGEGSETVAGDANIVDTYRREPLFNFDIFLERPVTAEDAETIEDKFDTVARQIEHALFDDIFFNKQLDGYDPNVRMEGLLCGLKYASTMAYDLRTEAGEILIGALRVTFEFPYEDAGYVEHKSDAFESYNAKINKVGYDDETVDPTLIEAEGDF